ncbi:hypothetical protein OG339_48670 (plasmid) [Streptosporangium sp. NBC_01495]|nr:hypothetical protein [Streptosporangium sp. NBC_01495]
MRVHDDTVRVITTVPGWDISRDITGESPDHVKALLHDLDIALIWQGFTR